MTYRYKTVKRQGKTVLLHRWLMEQHLGRPLLATEHVHHRNEDPFDNRLENLEVIEPRAHQAIHHPAELPVTKSCAVCGEEFTPHKTKRRRQQTCRWSCRNALIAHRRHGTPLAAALVRANLLARREAVVA